MRTEPVFEVSKWVDDRVQSSVTPLIADVPGMTWDKWRIAFQSAYLKDNKLGMAIAKNPNSALRALTACAQLGLSPDPALQHFALVPFGGEVNGMVQWQGWLHLAMESGRVVDGTITAEVIYKQEEATRDQTHPLVDPMTNRVRHQVSHFERDEWSDDDIIGAYAQAQVIDGPWVSTVMSRKAIQKRLAMGAGTAARKWFPEMCKAKVLGALLRSGRVPLSERTRRATQIEGEEVKVVQAEIVPIAPAAPVALVAPKTGGKVMFDELDQDPYPSDERMASNLTKAINAEFRRQEVDAEAQAAIIGSVAADATLDQLTEEELQFVLDRLTDGGKKAKA
jgi:recombinational DNA repair protein RecT|tara:strand:+ start:6565 stop:7575 length:1011 start_codon:yes stop_codon:yes gene_type:complete